MTSGAYSSISFLQVPLRELNSSNVYSCQVTHPSTNSNQRKEIQFTSDLIVFLREPTLKETWIDKTATLVCEVVSTIPTAVVITWTVDGQLRTEGTQIEAGRREGNQYVTIGRLTSSVEEWERGVEYTCSANDSQSSTVVTKRTRKTKAMPVVPKVHLMPPSPEEVKNTKIATLTCLISGFYPEKINITWEKDGTVLHSNISSSPTALEQDQTFSARSLLTVPAADWNTGARYSCAAFHLPSQSNEKRVIRSLKEIPQVSQEPEGYEVEEGLEFSDEDSNCVSIIITFAIMFIFSIFYGTCITLFKVTTIVN